MSILLSLHDSTAACYHIAGRMVLQDPCQDVGFEVAVIKSERKTSASDIVSRAATYRNLSQLCFLMYSFGEHLATLDKARSASMNGRFRQVAMMSPNVDLPTCVLFCQPRSPAIEKARSPRESRSRQYWQPDAPRQRSLGQDLSPSFVLAVQKEAQPCLLISRWQDRKDGRFTEVYGRSASKETAMGGSRTVHTGRFVQHLLP